MGSELLGMKAQSVFLAAAPTQFSSLFLQAPPLQCQLKEDSLESSMVKDCAQEVKLQQLLFPFILALLSSASKCRRRNELARTEDELEDKQEN